MDIERAFVSRMLATQAMQPALERSLEPHHFLQRTKGDENPLPMPGEVYGWMLHHVRHYRTVPNMGLALQRFPNFEFIDDSNSVEALRDEMVRQVKKRGLMIAIRELAEIHDDPGRVGNAEIHAFEVVSELARSLPSSAMTRYSDSINRLELNRLRAETGMTPGVSLLVPQLNELTYGIQSHEMAIIQGFLGQKKSTLAVMMSAEAYFERDQTPLFFSFEMEGDKLAARWDSYAAQISYRAMKRGQLGPAEYERWMRVAEKAAESKFEKDILVISDERRPTPDFIYGQIERWRPSFSVVDTLDEVRAPAHVRSYHEIYDYLARELKGVARSTKRPLIACAQSGRGAAEEGSKIDNIAGSITIPRKADIVVAIHGTPEQKKMHMTEFTLLKNRDDEGEGQKFTVYMNPGTGILRAWTPEDGIASKPTAQTGR